MLTRGTNCLYMKGEKSLSSLCRKSEKNDLTIISKPLAYSHTTIGTKLLWELHAAAQEILTVYIYGG